MKRQTAIALVVVAAGFFSSCLTTNAGDGQLKCALTGRACPSGYYCAADKMCWHNGHAPTTLPTCTDGLKNGDETDVDCGGSCPPCATGQSCGIPADCTTANCRMGVCTMPPPQCTNGVLDPGETDVDCGGPICAACATGKMCMANSDCLTMMCNQTTHVCFDQCNDGVKNGDETDVDCGGLCKNKCVASQSCGLPTDCATGTCSGGFCVAASGPPNWIKVADYPSGFVQFMSASAVGPDGVIYMFDGCRDPVNYPSACGEGTVSAKYDPATNQFTQGFMPFGGQAKHAGAAATLAPNGKIYLFEGFYWDSTANRAQPVTQVDAYDPVAKTWTANVATTPNGTLTYYSPVATVGGTGEIYVLGAYVFAVNNPGSQQAVGFTPTNNMIDTTVPMMPYGVWGAGAARASDGNLYVLLGGCRYCANPPDNYSIMSYNETTKMWAAYTKPLQLPTLRGDVGSALAGDGRIYVVGGLPLGATSTTATVEAYTPKSNNWATVASLGTGARWITTALAPDGRVFALGGLTVASGTGTFRSIIEAYGPVMNLVSARGAAGSGQGLMGSNFAANATVKILFGSTNTLVATTQTDTTGQISGTLVYHVPNVSPGTYRITAVDNKSNYPVYASFTVM